MIVKTENSSAINNAIKKILELYPAGASVNTVIGEIYITRKSIKENAGRPMQLYIHEVVSVQAIKSWGATVDSRPQLIVEPYHGGR